MGSAAMDMMTEARAEAEAWRYSHGFSEMRVVKLMVQMGVTASVVGPTTLSELSSAVGCPKPALYRIMRFLSHRDRGFFEQKLNPATSEVSYAPTPISRLLTLDNHGAYMLMQLTFDVKLSVEDLKAGRGSGMDPASTTDKLWDRELRGGVKVAFTQAMDVHSRKLAAALVKNAPATFQGIASLVDVGGRLGTTLGVLVKAFPWLRGTNLDLPGVVNRAPSIDGVVHVGGDMFKSVPKADAVMLTWVLHDWADEACINILKKCREAVPVDTGKVIIVDAVLDEDDEEPRDELSGARLLLDMTIMIGTANGKERTAKEWAKLIEAAGFTRHTINHIKANIESVIEAYP